MLRVALAPKAVAALDCLAGRERLEAISTPRRLPVSFGRPHLHSGIGIRRLRPGLYEARIGLSIRAVVSRLGEDLDVRMIGTLDEVRRFLKG